MNSFHFITRTYPLVDRHCEPTGNTHHRSPYTCRCLMYMGAFYQCHKDDWQTPPITYAHFYGEGGRLLIEKSKAYEFPAWHEYSLNLISWHVYRPHMRTCWSLSSIHELCQNMLLQEIPMPTYAWTEYRRVHMVLGANSGPVRAGTRT